MSFRKYEKRLGRKEIFMKRLLICFFGVAVIFCMCLNSCRSDKPSDIIQNENPLNQEEEKDSDIDGVPPRVYMHTWDELREMVQMAQKTDDHESWIAYLNENAAMDLSFLEKSDDPMSFENFIENIDVIFPVSLTDVELLNSYYTFDRYQFSIDCVYDGLVYRFACQPTATEFVGLTNLEYQLALNEKMDNESWTVASIGNISFIMYWNEEYHWYWGSFIHNDHTYNVQVYRYENRASGTAAISEEWHFDIFYMATLQEMITS